MDKNRVRTRARTGERREIVVVKMVLNDDTTDVVFRKWGNGDIIALFPYIKGDTSGRFCESYEHVGQHGGADYIGLLTVTKPAAEKEYGPLKRELESIGYCLRIIKRVTRRRIASC